MIESKYTIEYINPEELNKTAPHSRQNIYGFALGGLILAALAYFLITLPAKKTTHQPKVAINQQQPTKKKTNETTNLSLSAAPLAKKIIAKPAPIKPVISSKITDSTNQASLTPDIKTFESTNETKTAQKPSQTESLKKLKALLLDTQNRNKELATELDAQIMENMELATLLEDSLYKINKEDKSYIKELKKLENNTVKITTNNKTKKKSLTIKAPITPKLKSLPLTSENNKTVTQNKTKPSSTINQLKKESPAKKDNRVDLSTASQIEAIIANINTSSKRNKQTNLKNQQRGRGGIEASRVKLQTDINNMINSSKNNQFDKLQESLNDI